MAANKISPLKDRAALQQDDAWVRIVVDNDPVLDSFLETCNRVVGQFRLAMESAVRDNDEKAAQRAVGGIDAVCSIRSRVMGLKAEEIGRAAFGK